MNEDVLECGSDDHEGVCNDSVTQAMPAEDDKHKVEVSSSFSYHIQLSLYCYITFWVNMLYQKVFFVFRDIGTNIFLLLFFSTRMCRAVVGSPREVGSHVSNMHLVPGLQVLPVIIILIILIIIVIIIIHHDHNH